MNKIVKKQDIDQFNLIRQHIKHKKQTLNRILDSQEVQLLESIEVSETKIKNGIQKFNSNILSNILNCDDCPLNVQSAIQSLDQLFSNEIVLDIFQRKNQKLEWKQTVFNIKLNGRQFIQNLSIFQNLLLVNKFNDQNVLLARNLLNNKKIQISVKNHSTKIQQSHKDFSIIEQLAESIITYIEAYKNLERSFSIQRNQQYSPINLEDMVDEQPPDTQQIYTIVQEKQFKQNEPPKTPISLKPNEPPKSPITLKSPISLKQNEQPKSSVVLKSPVALKQNEQSKSPISLKPNEPLKSSIFLKVNDFPKSTISLRPKSPISNRIKTLDSQTPQTGRSTEKKQLNIHVPSLYFFSPNKSHFSVPQKNNQISNIKQVTNMSVTVASTKGISPNTIATPLTTTQSISQKKTNSFDSSVNENEKNSINFINEPILHQPTSSQTILSLHNILKQNKEGLKVMMAHQINIKLQLKRQNIQQVDKFSAISNKNFFYQQQSNQQTPKSKAQQNKTFSETYNFEQTSDLKSKLNKSEVDGQQLDYNLNQTLKKINDSFKNIPSKYRKK